MIPQAMEDAYGMPGGSDAPLAEISMGFLCYRCAEETERFFKRKDHDPRYCYELFRRAIMGRDEQAWNCLYHRYQKLVTGWLERNSLFSLLEEDAETLVNGTFLKMWQGLTPDKFSHFPDLKSILRYLQMCAHSTLVDQVRSVERQQRLTGDDPDEDPDDSQEEKNALFSNAPLIEEQVFYKTQAAELWRLLQSRLKNEKERQVIYGIYVLALKPSELKELYPESFRDVKEIYLVKENLVARLRRDTEFKKLYDNEIL